MGHWILNSMLWHAIMIYGSGAMLLDPYPLLCSIVACCQSPCVAVSSHVTQKHAGLLQVIVTVLPCHTACVVGYLESRVQSVMPLRWR